MKPKRRNLRKLANHLLNLPENYAKFDMSDYFKNDGMSVDHPSEVIEHLKECVHTCQTAACAVGHGPSLEGKEFRPNKYEDWTMYCARVFGIEESEKYDSVLVQPWSFMFGGHWSGIDNTTDGAALRILYFLDYGSPKRYLSCGQISRLCNDTYTIT